MTTSRSKTTKAKPRKKKSSAIPANIKQRALSMFQRMRRLQEANYKGQECCISCGKPIDWKEAQGGHYIKRGIEATCIDPDNVWPQCPQCNGYLKGNLTKYRSNLVKKIGETRVKRLENMWYASEGDEEAMKELEVRDQLYITLKKGKVFWNERYKEFKEEVSRLESQF